MNPDPPTASPAPAPSSRWRFSLRSLLIAVAVVSLGLAWARYQFGWWQPPRASRHSLELLDAARWMYEVDTSRADAGTATMEQLLATADRLYDAERQACASVEEELDVLRKHVARMRVLRRRCYGDPAPAGNYFFELARWRLAQVEGTGPLERERAVRNRLLGPWRVETPAVILGGFDLDLLAHKDKVVRFNRFGVGVFEPASPFGIRYERNKYNVDLFVDQDPPGIDLWFNEGDIMGSASGVFALEDDRLELCFVDPSGPGRPAAVTSAGGNAQVTVVLRRVPANDDPAGKKP